MSQSLPINDESTDQRIDSVNFRRSKGKTSPNPSATKNYSTRSTTSVVNDLIGGGATLVYDSSIPQNPPRFTAPSLSHYYYSNYQQQQQRKEHVRIESPARNLKTNKIFRSTNISTGNLTGRQRPTNHILHPRRTIEIVSHVRSTTSIASNVS